MHLNSVNLRLTLALSSVLWEHEELISSTDCERWIPKSSFHLFLKKKVSDRCFSICFSLRSCRKAELLSFCLESQK